MNNEYKIAHDAIFALHRAGLVMVAKSEIISGNICATDHYADHRFWSDILQSIFYKTRQWSVGTTEQIASFENLTIQYQEVDCGVSGRKMPLGQAALISDGNSYLVITELPSARPHDPDPEALDWTMTVESTSHDDAYELATYLQLM